MRSTLALLMLASTITANGTDIYVSQSGMGRQDGGSAANARAMTWLNKAGNWDSGPGTVNAGDTVHLLGTLTSTLSIQGDGAPNKPIIILFEPGANFTTTVWPSTGAIAGNCHSWISIDGGRNGVIRNTDNGTALSHKLPSSGIYGTALHHWVIRNLTISNLYQRTKQVVSLAVTRGGSGYTNAPIVTLIGSAGSVGSGATATAQISSAGAVTSLVLKTPGGGYNLPRVSLTGGGGSGATAKAATDWTRQGYAIQVSGSDITIQNNKLFDGDAMVSYSYGTGTSSNIVITGDTIGRVNHGINVGVSNTTTNCHLVNLTIANNVIDDLDAWDGNSGLHLDGIIIFNEDPTRTSSLQNLEICGNTIGPNVGITTTAAIFIPGYQAAAVQTAKIYNNLFLQAPGYTWSNGSICVGGNNVLIANNTICSLGTSPLGIGIGGGSGGSVVIANNLFYNQGTGINHGSETFTDTVTPVGTSGRTFYSYVVVGRFRNGGAIGWVSGEGYGTTSAGNASLSATNYNHLSWSSPKYTNAAGVSFDVYRTAGGPTYGRIVSGLTGCLSYDDHGAIGDGSAPPSLICNSNVYYNLGSNPFYIAKYNAQSTSAWKGLGFDINSRFARPMLDAKYVPLASDRVARNNGLNLSSWFTTDQRGVARPASGNWDVGANQSQ